MSHIKDLIVNGVTRVLGKLIANRMFTDSITAITASNRDTNKCFNTNGAIHRLAFIPSTGTNSAKLNGSTSVASSSYAVAEGDNTTASGDYSHAEGISTKAQVKGSHAEGSYTEANGEASHAEGNNTIASAVGAHAEGRGTKALYMNSHAEGYLTEANKDGAHAEGSASVGSGYAAHAEGFQTVASGDYSHAGGIGTIANQEAMTAIGKYNHTSVGNIGGNYLFVVGNGSVSSRSNTFAVTTDGITASLLNLSGGPYQGLQDPESGYPGGKISWSDDNCWIQETSPDELTIFSPEDLFLKSNGSICMNTNVLVTGNVNASQGFFQTSDERQKNIIGELDIDKAYELIDKCQTILYTLKDDKNSNQQVGLIAQEVKEFFPELITEDNDGALSLDYSRLTVIILKVLKDVINRIKILESK